MSDTPKTDAAMMNVVNGHGIDSLIVQSRLLERSNAELVAALKECISQEGSGATRSHEFAIRRLGYISDTARAAIAKAAT